MSEILGTVNGFDPSKDYLHLFDTVSDFEAAYNGQDYRMPWVSVVDATGQINFNKQSLLSISITNLTWVTDIPETGGTATKDNCTYNVMANYANGISVDVTSQATVTGSLVVSATSLQEYHSAGTLTLTATYSGLTASEDVTAYQEAAFVPYENRYLTLDVISGGTIMWKGDSGGNVTRTISYSKDDGQTWTEITSTTAGTPINVEAGDKVLFKGTNAQYATAKDKKVGFEGGTALYNAEGNVMSLIGGDNFTGLTTFTKTWALHSLFNLSKVVSAKNLILPATGLTQACYRAMFANATFLTEAPQLPATTLAVECYWYMFENCAIVRAPELLATTLAKGCYGNMFTGCTSLNYIKCLATDISASACTANWVNGVQTNSGTFVKAVGMADWTVGNSGIPRNWVTSDYGVLNDPVITCDGEMVEITCETDGAEIYYNLNQMRSYQLYTGPFLITANTTVDAYASIDGNSTTPISQNCTYNPENPYSAANKTLGTWSHSGQSIQTPYSVNAIDGHSSSYTKNTFIFETTIRLKKVQPTYLWFQHADQSADIYVDDVKVTTHWGGYNAFFTDITNYVHTGTNTIKVALCNTTRNALAPSAGDFNFNATLGNVKLFTSPVLPSLDYGYDGFHVTSDVATSSATITVKTTIPTGATVTCEIDDGTYHYGTSADSTGNEMMFSATITNPHLWNGKADPHLYNITLEVYYEGQLYHHYVRPYGLRFFDYALSGTTLSGVTGVTYNGSDYTGFLLNGSPYFLRGVCMHDDVDGKANALTTSDYTQEFNIIQELGCNFIRLAHYPHPKEVYDKCDELGIIVQTEVPCVNRFNSPEIAGSNCPQEYYDHLDIQYTDMVRQHFNHPCILFWGLFNEATTNDASWAKTKLEYYKALIKNIDPERWVGYVAPQGQSNPSSYMGNPDLDWFGGNIYVGWYSNTTSNNPTSALNTRINNIVTTLHKPLAYSEYGAGGTQHCHSDDFMTTTTPGNHERHDIEYQMWLHEGHLAAIRNFPQLLFTGEWQLFDIAVASRNEGYTVCLDGENATTDDNLRRLNNKGLVERDHITKKDTFYLYKAEWNPSPFLHICGKDYTKSTGRAIKCYTNQAGQFGLYVNGTQIGSPVTATDHIVVFPITGFTAGDTIVVSGGTVSDTFVFPTA